MRPGRAWWSVALPLALSVAAAGCVQSAAIPATDAPLSSSRADPWPPPPTAEVPTQPAPAARAAATQPLLAGRDEDEWSVGVSAYTYFAADDHDYVQPTVVLDRGRLHFEARYNYEALDAGSLWAGWRFDGGDEDGLAWEITPMAGWVFGEVTGVAPGYRGSIAWWRLELYGEGEYVFDTGGGDSFFYNWSELTIAPIDRLRLGIVTQRTRVYDTERDLQRGLLVGVGIGRFDVTAHVFNPDDDEPVVVVSVALGF